MGFKADAFGNSGSYSQSPNTPGNGYGSCSNVYCHSTVQANGGTGAPTYATPTWGGTVQCGDCHAGDGVNGNTSSVMATGSHTKHVSTYGFNCATCHNGAGNGTSKHADGNIDVIISTTYGASATYNGMPTNTAGDGYSTCSSVYCHSNGKVNDTGSTVGQYATPTWGGTVTCKSCHGTGGTSQVGEPDYANAGAGAVDANSHPAHIASLGASTTSCNKCHSQTVDTTGAINTAGGKHVNQTKDVVFADGGTYDSATKTCSTTYCHGTGTPQWGGTVACGDCHAVNNTLGGSHGTHWSVSTNATSTDRQTAANNSSTTNYQFTCAVCHNGATHAGGPAGTNQVAEVVFDATVAGGGTYTAGTTVTSDPNGFNYTDGSCSSTYCHSNGAGGAPNVTPTWGATLDCKSCHNYTAASGTPMASGSHAAHVSATVMSQKTCETCHNATTTDGVNITDKTKHVNHTVDVVLSATYGGTYSGTTKSCSSTYCHSNATALTAPYGAPNQSLAWGSGTATCSSCHDGPPTGPSYANGSPKANSHAKHTGAPWNFTCDKCHAATVSYNSTNGTYSISTPANHLNQQYDISGTDIGSYTYNAAGGTCSNIACHGGNSAQWGSTLSCQDCHLGSTDVDDYTFNNGVTATISSTEWTSSGHGQSTIGLSCNYCHDSNVTHGTGTNPFRLANNNVNGNGWNDVCLVCHMTGSTGYDPGTGLKVSSLKIDKYHYGASHTATYNGGKFCWDCHDPHGDGNIKMVQKNPAKTTDGTYGIPTSTPSVNVVFTDDTIGAGAGGFARRTAPYEEGICNACHDTAAGLNNYTSTGYDPTHYTTVCTQCHKHSADTTVDGNAFKPAGGNCDSCHGYPPPPHPDGTTTADPHQVHFNNIVNSYNPNGTWQADPTQTTWDANTHPVCAVCHDMSTTANHMDNTREVAPVGEAFDPNSTPTYDLNNTHTCSNIRCHFGKSPSWK